MVQTAIPCEDKTMTETRGADALVLTERIGSTLVVTLNRPAKRNALNDPTVLELERIFSTLDSDIRCAVITGAGDHFCAGLDLGELTERDVTAGIHHSMMWHRAFERIQFGRVPVVAALHGAVIGGGLELAASTHIRVAEPTTYYALPEGQRGIYVGGGASVRLPRIIGVDRMMDMMLTGRSLSAEEGLALGLSQYLVGKDEARTKAIALADRISRNAGLTNFALIQALPRIAESDRASGFFTEALMAAVAQGDGEAKLRLREFLDKKTDRVKPPH
jgi:enoyl-CoA hydratase/carnithine racemase